MPTSGCSRPSRATPSARRSTPSAGAPETTDRVARSDRDAPPPAPARPARRPAPRRLGERGRARLCEPPARGAARGRVRRRELLRADRARGAAGRRAARLHRPRVPARGATVPEGAHPSPCLGLCELAPAALRTIAGRSRASSSCRSEDRRCRRRRRAAPPPPDRRRRRPGVARRLPRARRLRGARRALELGPAGVIRAVSESHLLGRGGAAFPTGTKWEAVARQPARPHYLVCNADESEPGTFKDRVLMESDPFALVEAMTIAAYATGCEHGFVYVRAEYPLAHARLEHAFAQARAAGLLGDDVMGAGFAFDLELRIGAGAYVCGEETALFQSIEGYRGEPRNKPPFPVEVGLFGKPTVVNNVETLVNVLDDPVDGGRTRSGRIDGTRSSASRATSRGRDCTSCRSGRRCASCSRSPARGRRRRCCSAAPPARSCARTSSTCRSPSRTRAPPVRRSAPASSSSTTSPPTSSTPSCASPSSSATSRAASACPAASARCARRRRCTGSRRAPANGNELGGARRSRAGDARRVDLRARPDGRERRRVRDRRISGCSCP